MLSSLSVSTKLLPYQGIALLADVVLLNAMACRVFRLLRLEIASVEGSLTSHEMSDISFGRRSHAISTSIGGAYD